MSISIQSIPMSKTIYSQQQMELLKMNQYVQDCSQKYITFTDTCKIDTLKLDEKGEYYKDIFRGLGFPDFFIDSGAAKRTLGNWRHSLKMKGLPGMIGTKKGRKKTEKIDVSNMSKDEYITYLEAKTACLEELNRRILGHDP